MSQPIELLPAKRPLPEFPDTPNNSETTIAIMMTRRCNMTCAHCSVESSPHIKDEPTADELRARIADALAQNVKGILFTGGEPMLREELVLELMETCRQRGVASVMTTNGFWGKDATKARAKLGALRRAGLLAFTISYDNYHAEFQGVQPALNLADAAQELQIPININVTRVKGDEQIEKIVEPFEQHPHARMRFYDVQPVGRAKEIANEEMRGETGGFCNACCNPAISDDGRLMACNGPGYFAPLHSPLQVGNLRDHSLRELMKVHRTDPILDTIRTFGPEGLRHELQSIPEFSDFAFKKNYAGMCDLCGHLTSDAAAVEALRKSLSDPAKVAARVARFRVMNESRKNGQRGFTFANNVGAAQMWKRAVESQKWPAEMETVLGRADFDWNHHADYLIACGLSRSVLPLLEDEALLRWSPRFFAPRLQKAALREGMRELVQREALKHIDTALVELGATGVLMKGAAFLARENRENKNPSPWRRACGDIDLLVDAKVATRLHSLLLKNGFKGESDKAGLGVHHLSAISFRGVPVEIHTAIVPPVWRMPQKEMLQHAKPLSGYNSLQTFDAEGDFLHAVVHSSMHVYSFGLKTAWDMLHLLEENPDFDWSRLTRWANSLGAPRVFWTPLQVLADDLLLNVPASTLRQAPQGKRANQLAAIARFHLYRSFESVEGYNPFIRNGVFMLLHDSLSSRVRFVTHLLSAGQKSARGAAHKDISEKERRAQLLGQWNAAWSQGKKLLALKGNQQTKIQPGDDSTKNIDRIARQLNEVA